MTQNPIKLLFIVLFGLTASLHLSGQNIKGTVFNLEDSLPVSILTVVVYDSTGRVLTGTLTDENGKFMIRLPESSDKMKISSLDFVELYIINLYPEFKDTLNLGQIPMIKSTPYLQVQFKGVSEAKERRYQKQIIKDYNKKLKSYGDILMTWNEEDIPIIAKLEDQETSKRLKLSYILNFEKIKKTKANKK